jgi:hypothetical protein
MLDDVIKEMERELEDAKQAFDSLSSEKSKRLVFKAVLSMADQFEQDTGSGDERLNEFIAYMENKIDSYAEREDN